MLNSGLFSSRDIDWATPKTFFDELDAEFHFTLDACATAENAKCANFFSPEQDGLKQVWSGTVFMNPPYGRQILRWVEKAFKTAETGGATVVCLLPARTDTRWFWDFCFKGEVRFIRGRIKFERLGAKTSAPFPSCIVIFRPKPK